MKNFKLNKNIEKKIIDGELYLLNVDNFELIEVNECGKIVVEELAKGRDVDEIVSKVTEIFEISFETARKDVSLFIEKLLKEKIFAEK